MKKIKSLYTKHFIIIISLLLLFSCWRKKENNDKQVINHVAIPRFNSDSCFLFVETQIKYGPRIPNSEAHENAGKYLVNKLKRYGAQVNTQEFTATTYDGQMISLKNITAGFFPKNQNRILLLAHWDTRPFSDKDPVYPKKKFEGANDGASGVAVLLEIARLLSISPPPNVGIDIIFFDGEDWGEPMNSTNTTPPANSGLESWWCLGSQYWVKQSKKNSAQYGILLDMVGANGSHFFKEGISLKYANSLVERIWGTASRLGYSNVFVNQPQAEILDDHVFVNEIAQIPTVDIVHYDPVVGYFGDYHHSQKDNLSLISKETLGIVGTVLVTFIYEEK